MPSRSEPSDATPVRVAVADDSFLIREGLAQLLALSPRITVTGLYADSDTLLRAIATDAPHVVVTDVRMPPTHSDEGIALAERLRRTHPRLGVIVLSQYGNPQYAARLIAGGAEGRGYLLKDCIPDLEHFVATICAVAAGECRIDAQLVAALVAARSTRSPLDDLTPRQREILADIARGMSNLTIARERNLTQGAVEKHVNQIFGRLGIDIDEAISRRVQATLIYLGRRTA